VPSYQRPFKIVQSSQPQGMLSKIADSITSLFQCKPKQPQIGDRSIIVNNFN